jgi:hypothetical protein
MRHQSDVNFPVSHLKKNLQESVMDDNKDDLKTKVMNLSFNFFLGS